MQFYACEAAHYLISRQRPFFSTKQNAFFFYTPCIGSARLASCTQSTQTYEIFSFENYNCQFAGCWNIAKTEANIAKILLLKTFKQQNILPPSRSGVCKHTASLSSGGGAMSKFKEKHISYYNRVMLARRLQTPPEKRAPFHSLITWPRSILPSASSTWPI